MQNGKNLFYIFSLTICMLAHDHQVQMLQHLRGYLFLLYSLFLQAHIADRL